MEGFVWGGKSRRLGGGKEKGRGQNLKRNRKDG